jgi:uncharacterized protein (TIGR02271 family)
MSSKIVALFDDRSDAERARQELFQSGFGTGDIEISSRERDESAGRGFWDSVKEMFGMEEETDIYREAARRGGTLLAVRCDEGMIDRAVDILQRHRPADIDRKVEEWRKSGWTSRARTESAVVGESREQRTAYEAGSAPVGEARPLAGESRPIEGRAESAEGEQRIPVAEEKVKIGKRMVSRGGVRVYTRISETPVEEEVSLREEKVSVERRPADRPAGEEAFRERTVEARAVSEEPVIQKEARVVEEVVVGKDVSQRTEKVQETVRRTEVEVEHLDAEFRKDFDARYGNRGTAYEQYQPAYNYGRELALSSQYQHIDWSQVEPDARRSFETRNPGKWDEYKDAIRLGFERTRSELATTGSRTPGEGI